MIAVVAIIAIIVILRACSALLSPPEEEILLAISPAEVSLCPGDQRQFTLQEGGEAAWEATGGTVTQSGLYSAGFAPGDYTVKASRDIQESTAVVHIVVCTATPTYIPTIAPTETPIPPTESPELDPQADVEVYETESLVAAAPAGVDIKGGSVQLQDLRVVLQPAAEDIPAELAGWTAEGEALIWLSLHTPIPDPPALTTRWIFVLDMDGNATTGRAPGTLKINRGLGDEVALLLTYSGGSYGVEDWVWDSSSGSWVAGPGGVRYKISDSRTMVALALPLDAFSQAVLQRSGATANPDAAKGRVAADAYGEQRVIDYYPNP
jgi:hypothetical protein